MAEAVKVIVRCRPLNTREKDLKCKIVVKMVAGKGICEIKKPASTDPPKSFTFDGAYFTDSTTEAIYADIAYPLVDVSMNCTSITTFQAFYLLCAILCAPCCSLYQSGFERRFQG